MKLIIFSIVIAIQLFGAFSQHFPTRRIPGAKAQEIHVEHTTHTSSTRIPGGIRLSQFPTKPRFISDPRLGQPSQPKRKFNLKSMMKPPTNMM